VHNTKTTDDSAILREEFHVLLQNVQRDDKLEKTNRIPVEWGEHTDGAEPPHHLSVSTIFVHVIKKPGIFEG
jgi:hypothetical protein